MKRRVIQLVLLLLAGAIVNVAVAWGCAIRSPLEKEIERSQFDEHDQAWFEQIHVEAPFIGKGTRVHSVYKDGIGTQFRWGGSWEPIDPRNPRSDVFVISATSGWPMFSLFGSRTGKVEDVLRYQYIQYMEYKSGGSTGRVPITRGGSWQTISLPASWQESDLYPGNRFLPIVPLWPGFAINTIFYAAILWVLFFVPGQLKRTLRRRRGLCPACAYPVGTSPVCTECGAALDRHGELQCDA